MEHRCRADGETAPDNPMRGESRELKSVPVNSYKSMHTAKKSDSPNSARTNATLKKMRARVLQIEHRLSHEILDRTINEPSWMSQRFAVPALIAALLMAIVILIGLGIIQLFSGQKATHAQAAIAAIVPQLSTDAARGLGIFGRKIWRAVSLGVLFLYEMRNER